MLLPLLREAINPAQQNTQTSAITLSQAVFSGWSSLLSRHRGKRMGGGPIVERWVLAHNLLEGIVADEAQVQRLRR
eukprot:COSAG05_NODE_1956_length_3789_cov_3.679404_4_plen_76_part_00